MANEGQRAALPIGRLAIAMVSVRWLPCAADEIALLPPPDGLAGLLAVKLSLFFPYPLIQGLEELPCHVPCVH